jgi:diamine N-acetyltransferase
VCCREHMLADGTVRSASERDLADLVRLCAEVHAIHVRQYPWRFRPLDQVSAHSQFERWIADPQFRCLVAESDGGVVGYVLLIVRDYPENAFCYARRFLEIDQIGVEQSRRGHGVGGKLMEAAKDLARDEAIDQLELNVWRFNETARRFFSKHGFDVVRERRICRMAAQLPDRPSPLADSVGRGGPARR